MGFQKIEKGAGGQPASGVAIGNYVTGRRTLFNIRLGSDVMERLGVKHGDRVVVENGTGKDTGSLRLSVDKIFGFRISKTSGRVCCAGLIRFAALATGQKRKSAPAPYKFRNGTLYIELPDWAYAKAA